MRSRKRLISIILSTVFLGAAVPLFIYLLSAYDRFHSEDPNKLLLMSIIWGGIVLFMGAAAILIFLTDKTTGDIELNLDDSTKEHSNPNEVENIKDEESESDTDTFSFSSSEIKAAFRTKKDITEAGEKLLSLIAKKSDLVQGALYTSKKDSKIIIYEFKAGYAFHLSSKDKTEFEIGEGLVGQVAKSQKQIVVSNLEESNITTFSGLGESKPNSILVSPIIHKKKTIGILELSYFKSTSQDLQNSLNEVSPVIAESIIGLDKNTDNDDS